MLKIKKMDAYLDRRVGNFKNILSAFDATHKKRIRKRRSKIITSLADCNRLLEKMKMAVQKEKDTLERKIVLSSDQKEIVRRAKKENYTLFTGAPGMEH